MSHYTYTHPEGKGLGEHHAGGGLGDRPAQPPEATAAMTATLEAMRPTPEQRATMEALLSATMADLDMASGTRVEHVATDEDTGHLIVAWTDATGGARRTSVAPEFFAAHFEPVQAAQPVTEA